ncbi:MAG: serine/threonine-protein phosphatase [Planctomycetes bacterium]|nr:serine/threonine-protein phosphatase [Planctomycetota bacterium]
MVARTRELAHLEGEGLTDRGRCRPENEDAFALLPERGLFIVSDGMGGAHAGGLASRMVVAALPLMLERRLQTTRLENARTHRSWLGQAKAICSAIRDSILELSRALREQSAGQPGFAGMGATVVLALSHRGHLFFANMGDSRLYLLRRKTLKRLTEDHSIVGILLRGKRITEAEARCHPARGKLSRYVGMEGLVYPDVRFTKLTMGDRFLLCTDGLTEMVSEAAIRGTLLKVRDPAKACAALVSKANAAGGRDNVTAVVIDPSPVTAL